MGTRTTPRSDPSRQAANGPSRRLATVSCGNRTAPPSGSCSTARAISDLDLEHGVGDEAFRALRDETEANQDTEDSEHRSRWRRTVERARFRHGELDFATARTAGAVAAARTSHGQR